MTLKDSSPEYFPDYQALFTHSPQPQFLLNREGRVLAANQAALTLCGYQQGAAIDELLHERVQAVFWPKFLAWLDNLDSHPHLDIRLDNHKCQWYRLCVGALALADANLYLVSLQDVSELYENLQRGQQIANVFEHSSEGIMITDQHQRIVNVNPAFSRITGYSCEEVVGKTPQLLSSGRHDKNFYEHMWQELESSGFWQGEIWNRKKNGELFAEWQTITVVKEGDENITHFVSFFTDITKIKRAEQELYNLAHHDPLTGLPNRLMLMNLMERSLSRAKRQGKRVALLFLDLDRFKIINDTMGHPVGDELLVEVSERLMDSVRQSDTVARLGGDEFIILLDEVTRPEDAAFVAKKVISAIRAPIYLHGREIIVTTSIGISMYPDDVCDHEELLKAADTAMYRAKEMGRNVYQFYTADLTHTVQEQLDMESQLREAVAKQQLELYYQPQIDTDTGQMVGVEALLRWHHPQRGMVSPAKFLPLAEETGLINEIGLWVLRTAVSQIKQWQLEGLTAFRVAVNLSARQLLTDDITWQVDKVLKEFEVDPGLLELEILEDTLHNADDCVVTFHTLKSLGIHLSIDDFGSGYSSLSRLKSFPIDQLKIDKAFVKNIAFDKDDQSICRAVFAMGESLGLQVVAEGVENSEQLEILRAQGGTIVQGFFFAKPMPAKAIPDFIQLHGDAFNRVSN